MDICEPYEPDLQDELIGDAMAVGGRRFAEEATFEATALAEQTCPWDGRGDEPAAYRSAWLAHLGQLVAARRAALVRSSATPHPRPERRVAPAVEQQHSPFDLDPPLEK